MCDFEPKRDLAAMMCANDVDADACFTTAQLQTIEDFYRGPYDSAGTSIIKGRAPGAERGWTEYIPHAGNQMFPTHLYNARDHTAFLFYENDPGVPVPRANDLSYVPDKTATPPEWAWWEFDIDDLTAGKADLMKQLMNATDPNLERFLLQRNGKLILWHGWNDAGAPPEPTKDYYDEVVARRSAAIRERRASTRGSSCSPAWAIAAAARGRTRGIRSRRSSQWVENGTAPEHVVATHSTDGRVDNERRVCAYPQVARYTGPADGANDPAELDRRELHLPLGVRGS